MKKSKRAKAIKKALRVNIQGLYEIAEIIKGKKFTKEVYYAIKHLNKIIVKSEKD